MTLKSEIGHTKDSIHNMQLPSLDLGMHFLLCWSLINDWPDYAYNANPWVTVYFRPADLSIVFNSYSIEQKHFKWQAREIPRDMKPWTLG